MALPALIIPALSFLGINVGRQAATTAVTSAAGVAVKKGWAKRGMEWGAGLFKSKAGKVAGAGAGTAVVGGGAATIAGASILGSLFTAGVVLAAVAVVGVIGFGVYKMISGGGSSAEEVAAENPELAQALAPALAPQMTMAPMMPQPMMGQPQYPPQYPMMQGGMIPNAAYATSAYPAAVVDVPQMMQAAPANAWQERVGGNPVQQGSYARSITDSAAIAAMNNQQIQ